MKIETHCVAQLVKSRKYIILKGSGYNSMRDAVRWYETKSASRAWLRRPLWQIPIEKKREKREMIISAVVHLSALMCGYETFVQLLEYSRVREIGEERNTEILFVVHLYHDDTPS